MNKEQLEKIEELEKIVQPVVEYINKKYDPHTSIIVEFDKARIVRDEMQVIFEISDKECS